MTLTEVLVATALATVVIMVLGIVDVNRFRTQEDLRIRATNQVSQTVLALAGYHIARSLEQADRIVILDSGIDGVNPRGTPPGPGKIKFRYPTCLSPVTPVCLDAAANYAWGEYRLSGTRLEFFSNGCGSPEVLAPSVSALTFQYKAPDAGNPPLGGDPFAPTGTGQNNVVEYSLTWTGGGKTYVSRGDVASRAIAYTDVNADLSATAGDSGDGLAPVVAPPPAC